ncbi:RNA polymerase sigma factor [Sandaracinus amylolyticus]|nr:RNA polymerase sigma factor [Sandaracinus amylolyticus]
MKPSRLRAPRVVTLRTADALSDRELVQRARGGDRWAEDALVRRHFADVAATVARLLGDRLDAEDVVQDTIEATLAELPHLRDPDAVRSWMMQIAVRKVHRRFRRRTLLRALGLASGEPEGGLASLASDACSPDQRAELALLDRALAKLAAADRIAWSLRYVEDMPLEDVARSCGCSLATVKRRIARADEHVRAHVSFEPEED